MRKLFILALVLFSGAAYAAHKPEAVVPAPSPQVAMQCGALTWTLDQVAARLPIVQAMQVGPEMGDPLRAWVGQMPPVDTTPYDLIVLILHTNGQYGVWAGWKMDPKFNTPSLCVGILITPELTAEFEKITGLKAEKPPAPKNDRDI